LGGVIGKNPLKSIHDRVANVAKLATFEWGSYPINEYLLMDFTCYASQLVEIYDVYQWL